MGKNIVKHEKFQDFQNIYGAIPASDKSDLHIIKSRMLQGIYRNEILPNEYCNYLTHDCSFINFMRNKKLENDALDELKDIKKRERLTDEKRLFTNLLSSQPLAFNLFLPLRWDNYSILTNVLNEIFPNIQISKILNFKLEYVPGDEGGINQRKITIDRSCFDVYIEFKNNDGQTLGLGIEVKYTEPFSQTDFRVDQNRRIKYIEKIKEYKLFRIENTELYLSQKYNQLFRNQLICEEIQNKIGHKCIQLVLFSSQDKKCINSTKEFQELITNRNNFDFFTIENFVTTILKYCNQKDLADLYKSIYDRYCNYNLLNSSILLNTPPKTKLITENVSTNFNQKEQPKIAIIKISDIPSSLNWKEIYDFSMSFDINVIPQKEVNELAIYTESYYAKKEQLDENIEINQLRCILLEYIKKNSLIRETYPNYNAMKYLREIINRLNQIMYNELWDNR